MTRKRVDYRQLLGDLIPRHQLSPELSGRVERALASEANDLEIESLVERVVEELVAKGVFVPVSSEGGRRRFLDRESGSTLTIEWPGSSRDIVTVPVPPPYGAPRLALDVVRNILAIETPLLPPDTHAPASVADVVRAAIRIATDLTHADFVTFVPETPPGQSPAAAIEPSGLTLAPAHAAVLRELMPDDGNAAVYVPDLRRFPAVAHVAPADGYRSLVFAAVRGSEGASRGLIEAWSRRRAFLGRDDVVALALLADRLSEGMRKAEALERFVFYDRLTGLYNREFFNRELDKEIARARRAGHPFALAIADIDDFKGINTRYGYYGANELLEQLAALLKRSIRPFDIAARWGGEEFALILTAPIGDAEAIVVCNRLREAVRSHAFRTTGLDMAPHEVSLTVSIGVSLFPSAASESRELWTAANGALQEAKRTGKDRVVDAGA